MQLTVTMKLQYGMVPHAGSLFAAHCVSISVIKLLENKKHIYLCRNPYYICTTLKFPYLRQCHKWGDMCIYHFMITVETASIE